MVESISLVVCILTSMFCRQFQSKAEAKWTLRWRFSFRVEPMVKTSQLGTDFFFPLHFLKTQKLVFCWASWFWNRKNEVELEVCLFLVCSDSCLESCRFHSTDSKKGMTCVLLLSRVLFACCVVQASTIFESSLISGLRCWKRRLCTKKRSFFCSFSFSFQPVVWNSIHFSFKDLLHIFLIFSFSLLFASEKQGNCLVTKTKKYPSSNFNAKTRRQVMCVCLSLYWYIYILIDFYRERDAHAHTDS